MGALDADSEVVADRRRPARESGPEIAPAARPSSATLALLEVIDRDGHVRQAWPIHSWPVTVGRGLDNDVVLSDPHIAAQHFRIEAGDGGLALRAGDSVNGVLLGSRHVQRGAVVSLPRDTPDAVELVAGRTRLRLRVVGAQLAPELPLGRVAVRHLRIAPSVVLALLLLAGLAFNTYLEADPDNLVRAAGNALFTALAAAALWCGAWTLLSKTITRQGHFGWHLRVFLIAGLALLALAAVPALLAFAFSWPWLTDYSFIATFAIGATALYFHLLALEPARLRRLRWVVATGAVIGIALALWFNLQRTGRVGDELYMSHLFPPALRLARPLATDRFVEGLAPLHARLDKKAKEPPSADGFGGGNANTRNNDDDE